MKNINESPEMEKIDCLILGHYEMGTSEIHSALKAGGVTSGSYRDFNLGFVTLEGNNYSLTELYNSILNKNSVEDKIVRNSNTFNAAISYLGTYLNKRNTSFDYITSVDLEKERLEKILTEKEVLSIALLTTLYVTPTPIIEIVDFIRSLNDKVKIFIGGPYISTMCRTHDDDYIAYVAEHVLKGDYYINSSQGERAMVNLIEAIKNNDPIDDIENVFYIEDGKLIKNKMKAEQNTLNENMVDWSLFKSDNKEYVNIRTAISCPFTCAFCGFPENAGKYQTVPPEMVIEELHQLVKFNPEIKSIYFIDDTFNVPKKRFKELLRLMIKSNFDFKWHSYYRCQFADEESIELMKESGCEGVFLGIESGSDTILGNMNKGSKVRQYEKGIKLLKRAGITTFGAFITGFPGENESTIKETIDFIENSGLDFFRTQMWFCEHITPIWRQREKYDIKGEGFTWSHSTMDSNTASNYVEEVFCNIKNVTWLPQHDFDFENVWRLVHNGISIEEIKRVAKLFNKDIKKKILNPSNFEMAKENYQEIESIISNKILMPKDV
ncbi:PhpK family radical SAM P-methyltransferase [Dokdonia sp.]|uniref:PhpK family radical SAM P-methyltransferase n=1 Tax=Dokdonia sp. TaxID=2024995 RepID=UPI0032646EAF